MIYIATVWQFHRLLSPDETPDEATFYVHKDEEMWSAPCQLIFTLHTPNEVLALQDYDLDVDLDVKEGVLTCITISNCELYHEDAFAPAPEKEHLLELANQATKIEVLWPLMPGNVKHFELKTCHIVKHDKWVEIPFELYIYEDVE